MTVALVLQPFLNPSQTRASQLGSELDDVALSCPHKQFSSLSAGMRPDGRVWRGDDHHKNKFVVFSRVDLSFLLPQGKDYEILPIEIKCQWYNVIIVWRVWSVCLIVQDFVGMSCKNHIRSLRQVDWWNDWLSEAVLRHSNVQGRQEGLSIA